MPKGTVILENPFERLAGWSSRALRILVLDDEYPAEEIAKHLSPMLGSDFQRGCVTLSSPYDKDKSVKAAALYWPSLGLEVISLTNLVDALNCYGVHFDGMLLDIDFGHQDKTWPGFSKGSSHLGGILMGLAYGDRPRTVLYVFTGADSAMRLLDNADYYFIAEVQRMNNAALGSLTIKQRKVPTEALAAVMQRWFCEVLPLLEPKAEDLLTFVQQLTSEQSLTDKQSIRTVYVRGQPSVDIFDQSVLFSACTILPSDAKQAVARCLSARVCGHQLVRRAFCKVAHITDLSTSCIAALLEKQRDPPCCTNRLHQNIQNDFHLNLLAAMKLFGISQAELFLNKLIKDAPNKCQTYTRMDISKTLGLQPDLKARIFGLFEDPDHWRTEFKSECERHLLSNGSDKLRVECCNLDKNGNVIEENSNGIPPVTWGRKIAIIGNRTDAAYLTINGGSVDTFVRHLHLHAIASTLQLVGPYGVLNLKHNGQAEHHIRDTVALELTVHHTPATEPD